MDEIKNIVKIIIETAQECKNGGNYDTAFSLADIAKNRCMVKEERQEIRI